MKKIELKSEIMERTSNDIIAGNGRVLKAYKFIVWLYLLKKYLYDCDLTILSI